MKTIEQQRAHNALARVNELRKSPPDAEFLGQYRSYVDRLGPAILMNGLGQALATEIAAAGPNPSGDRERAHSEVYAGVQSWLCRQDGGVYPAKSDLLRAIVENDEAHYLRAQAEALAWLEWHKKFCRAYLPSDKGND